MEEIEDPASKKCRLSRERQQRWRARQSQDTLARLQGDRRHLETTNNTRARLHANAEANQLRRKRETLQQTQTPFIPHYIQYPFSFFIKFTYNFLIRSNQSFVFVFPISH